jgi:2-methylaconitate cis-trans-isomerase PrpF
MTSTHQSSSSSRSDDYDIASTAITTPSPPPELSSYTQRRKLRAVLMRAGSSKGIFVHLSDLPEDRRLWGPILLAAMGSPDPFDKQLNGVGGGSSTQSKVGIISPSADPRADVDYLFCQGESISFLACTVADLIVPVDGTELDFTGNCGNMAAGVGPFAVE